MARGGLTVLLTDAWHSIPTTLPGRLVVLLLLTWKLISSSLPAPTTSALTAKVTKFTSESRDGGVSIAHLGLQAGDG